MYVDVKYYSKSVDISTSNVKEKVRTVRDTNNYSLYLLLCISKAFVK